MFLVFQHTLWRVLVHISWQSQWFDWVSKFNDLHVYTKSEVHVHITKLQIARLKLNLEKNGIINLNLDIIFL